MLARTFEAGGLSTVLVTNMPFWAGRIGVPRGLAVEAPFGHLLGQPGDIQGQRMVIDQALQVLVGAKAPGTIDHSSLVWPHPLEQAVRDWQPEEPSPIVQVLSPMIKTLLRERRGKPKS